MRKQQIEEIAEISGLLRKIPSLFLCGNRWIHIEHFELEELRVIYKKHQEIKLDSFLEQQITGLIELGASEIQLGKERYMRVEDIAKLTDEMNPARYLRYRIKE